MTKLFTLLATCSLLAACGDPLRDVDRLSSVDLAEDNVTVGALPDPADTVAPRGLFSTLFRSGEPATALVQGQAQTGVPDTDGAVGAALAGVNDPAIEGETTSITPVAVAAPVAEKRGLFGWGRKKAATQDNAPIVTATTTKTLPVAEPTAAVPAVATAQTAEIAATAPAVVAAAQPAPRKGLFARLAGARAQEKSSGADPAVRTASLGPVAAPKSSSQKQTAFRGRAKKHKGPDAQIVPFGTALPAGAIARVCDLPNGRLGKEVGKFPERGRGYKMFDSNPSSASPRPFYVTGFDDKCARTFTAALALFGSPSLHEQLRYGLPGGRLPYSTTDEAYEGVKRSVCGVGKRTACGPKIALLEKDTVFISIYDRIGSNSKWSNVLIHKGWVLAADRKG